MYFKSKKQEKTFDFINNNVVYNSCMMNSFNHIIIDVNNLLDDEIEKVLELTKNIDNIVINKNHKKISII